MSDGSRSSSGFGNAAGTRGGTPPTGAGRIFVAALGTVGKVPICDTGINAGTVATAGAFDITGSVETGLDVIKGALAIEDGSLGKGRLATGCALAIGGIFDMGGMGAIDGIDDTIGRVASTDGSVGSGMGAVVSPVTEPVSVGAWVAKAIVAAKS